MADPTSPPPPRLASDSRRNATSLALAALIALAAVAIYSAIRREEFSINVVIVTAFVFWTCYCLIYLGLTLRTFSRAGATDLASWLRTTTPRRAIGRLEQDLSGSGPTAAVQWSIIAIASVAALTLSPGLLDDALANALSVAVVASAWLVTVAAYAVHYARANTTHPGLEFPGGKHELVFFDYLYLSAQISTTFSSSDVSVTTTRSRRMVTGHTLIAFAFNTFIIALLISILFLTD
jgi:uncharacterized membrane protein